MQISFKYASALGCLGAMLCLGAAAAQTKDAPPPPQSQGAPSPGGGQWRGGPEHWAEMLQHALDLSADQTNQVKAILESERTRMEALRSNTSLAQQDRRAQALTIREATNIRIRALLTTDQTTKFDAMEARMRERRGPGGAGPGGPPPPPDAPGPGER